MSMSLRHLESFLSETRSLVMRAYTLRPARALTSRAAGLATRPVATAERKDTADILVRICGSGDARGVVRVVGAFDLRNTLLKRSQVAAVEKDPARSRVPSSIERAGRVTHGLAFRVDRLAVSKDS